MRLSVCLPGSCKEKNHNKKVRLFQKHIVLRDATPSHPQMLGHKTTNG